MQQHERAGSTPRLPPDLSKAEGDALGRLADAVEFRIAKLEMAEGDILVVQTATEEQFQRLPMVAGHLRRFLPAGCQVMLIPPSLTLSTMTRKEIEDQIGPATYPYDQTR